MPNRIQRRRTAGRGKPFGSVCVSRPSVFGNPFTREGAIEAGFLSPDASPEKSRQFLADCFRDWITGASDRTWWQGPESDHKRAVILATVGDLRGKDLVCWCPTSGACHADTLINLANQ